MKLHIVCQYAENYGAHDWDGTGECPQYWKMKGGEDYFVPLDGFKPDHEFAEKKLAMIVDSVRSKIEWNDIGSRQYVVGYGVVADDFLTDFEQSQLEYEGRIDHPARVLELA
jgi:hypothetical protein